MDWAKVPMLMRSLGNEKGRPAAQIIIPRPQNLTMGPGYSGGGTALLAPAEVEPGLPSWGPILSLVSPL